MRAFIFILYLVVCIKLQAQNAIEQYQQFTRRNGLTEQIVGSAVADEKGYIWLMSSNVVQRYNGNAFSTIPTGNGDNELPKTSFTQILKTADKKIWIFHQKGIAVYNNATSHFKHLSTLVPITASIIGCGVIENNNHVFLKIKDNTYYSINKKTYEQKIFTLNNIKQQQQVFLNYSYLVYPTSTLIQLAFSPYFKCTLNATDINAQGISNFYCIKNKIYAFGHNGLLQVYDVSSGKKIHSQQYNYKLYTTNACQTIQPVNDSVVLLAGSENLLYYNLNAYKFLPQNVNAIQTVKKQGYYKCVYIDDNKNVWLTTNLYGVFKAKLKSNFIQNITTIGSKNLFVKCVAVNKKYNKILVGTYGEGLVLYDSTGKLIKQYLIEPNAIVSEIIAIDKKYYLVAVYRSNKMYKLNAETGTLSVLQAKNADHISIGYYLKFYLSNKENELYFFDENCKKLSFNANGYWLSVTPLLLEAFIKNNRAIYLHAFNKKQLYVYQKQINLLQKKGIEEVDLVAALPTQKCLFIATTKGVYSFDNNATLLHCYNVEAGLADNNIYSLLVDKQGDVWCTHNKGVSKLLFNGQLHNFYKEDGLQDDEFNYASACVDENGKLYFGGVKGLSMFYPSCVKPNTYKAFISEVSVGDKSLNTNTMFSDFKQITVNENNNDIKIKLGVANVLANMPYNFQYKILNYKNSVWVNQQQNANINLALPSGKYTLLVAASDVFNKNITTQAQIDIVVKPKFYKTIWFVLLMAVLLAAIIWAITFYLNKKKYQKKIQIIKNERAIEIERQRISRDLHDNIGAYTSALLSNVEQLKKDNIDAITIEKINSNAHQILGSLKDTIWVLQQPEISLIDLSDKFKSYANKLLHNYPNIQFDVQECISKTETVISSMQAVHIHNILQEAFQNAVKHSGANCICFTVNDTDKMLFELKDNGAGFDANSVLLGNGLNNMRWRAKEAKFSLNIQSAANNGTIISITL